MRVLIILFIGFIAIISINAQDNIAHIIFTYDGRIWSQPTNDSPTIDLASHRDNFETVLTGYDAYTPLTAPLAGFPSAGYGFHHGIWSPDRTQFVYLQIAPPNYEVRRIMINDNTDNLLLSDQIRANFGYLDPIAFTADGQILLLERYALHHIDKVNVFIYNPDLNQLDFFTSVLTGHLVGRTAILPDSTSVFLGFDFDTRVGIILDTVTQQIQRFTVSLETDARGFDHLPIPVYGAVSQQDLVMVAQEILAQPDTLTPQLQPAPFLHWPLADSYRYITCLPDSEWTYANYTTNCPGLAGRNYEGHEGTDVSEEPDALLIGTPIYPSATGTVIYTYRDCLGVNPSCNNAYGNTLTMEHIQIVNGATQVWYTGYGHLQMPLADDFDLITDLTQPIALSGATGIGGPHLHFEVRTTDDWIDPWDDRFSNSLWLGGNARPLAVVTQNDMTAVPRILDVCTSYAGNNLRSGAGTTYDTIGQTVTGKTYFITAVENVQTGEGIGDWYEVLFDDGQGWLWSGVMNCP